MFPVKNFISWLMLDLHHDVDCWAILHVDAIIKISIVQKIAGPLFLVLLVLVFIHRKY